jgi:GTP cyclohydrolase I
MKALAEESNKEAVTKILQAVEEDPDDELLLDTIAVGES